MPLQTKGSGGQLTAGPISTQLKFGYKQRYCQNLNKNFGGRPKPVASPPYVYGWDVPKRPHHIQNSLCIFINIYEHYYKKHSNLSKQRFTRESEQLFVNSSLWHGIVETFAQVCHSIQIGERWKMRACFRLVTFQALLDINGLFSQLSLM